MKRTYLNQFSALAMSVLAWSGLCGQARAQWGSVHANNRSPNVAHAPVRSEPTRSEPVRTETRAVPAPAVRSQPVVPQARAPEINRGREEISRGHVELPHVSHDAEIARGHEFERRDHDLRRWDIHADRGHLFWWSGFYPGFVVATLPPGYLQVPVAGTPYYYYEGTY